MQASKGMMTTFKLLLLPAFSSLFFSFFLLPFLHTGYSDKSLAFALINLTWLLFMVFTLLTVFRTLPAHLVDVEVSFFQFSFDLLFCLKDFCV
jgi:hypothetical protein